MNKNKQQKGHFAGFQIRDREDNNAEIWHLIQSYICYVYVCDATGIFDLGEYQLMFLYLFSDIKYNHAGFWC